MPARLTYEQISEQLQKVNPRLKIDKETYTSKGKKCKFIDPEHGEFWAFPFNVLNGATKGHPNSTIERRKNTIKRKYKVEHFSQLSEIKEKKSKTCLENYGVENPSQSDEVKKRKEKTLKKNYGVDNPSKSEIIKKRREQTCINRYGYSHNFKSEEVRKQIKDTFMSKYGSENPFGSKKVQEKIKETNLEKYGVEYISQVPEIQERIRQTMASNGYESAPEREVKDFVRSLGFNTVKSFIVTDKSSMELDILIEEKRVAIEYNGDWWHSEANPRISRTYHLNKTLECLKKGIQLIHVFGHEWEHKNTPMKDFIKSKLGVFDRRIYARKCEIREVDKEEAKKFLNNVHIRGNTNSLLRLGLYFKEELVALTTFSIPHRQNMDNLPNLSRFACLPGVQVVGGLSRLSKHAFDKIGPFVTFVERQRSEGDAYLASGYRKIKTLPPDYFYTNGNKIISKQSRRKRAVSTPENMTEREHALQDGLYRIWDCGKYKFIYEGQ